MDEKAVQYFWALQRINTAMLEGLKLALHVMEKWDELSLERRKSSIQSLKKLISQGEEVFGKEHVEH